MTDTMRTIRFTRYGPEKVLELAEQPLPQPGEGQIRVRIVGSSVNDWDENMMRGQPFFMRAWYGWLKPKPQFQVIGCDMAGVVDATGDGVTRFAPGDRVYGDLHAAGFGAWADYCIVAEDYLAPLPKGVDLLQAAALPHSLTLAWQALQMADTIEDGSCVLVNGAGGGVGSVVLPMLKTRGAHVTAVDRGSKLQYLLDAGYDEVISFEEQDFTRGGKTYDFILDTRTTRFAWRYLGVLKPGGSYITIGGTSAGVMSVAMLGGLLKRLTGKSLGLLALKANKGLDELAELVSQGKVTTAVDGPFDLSEARDAIAYYKSGLQQGRILVTMCKPDSLTGTGQPQQ